MTYFIVAYYEMKSHACLLLFIVLITSLQLTIYDGHSAALPAFNNIQPIKQTWNGICCQLKATDHTTRHLNASWYGFLAGFMRPHFTQSYLYWHDIGLWYEPYIPWNMNLILLCFVLIVVLLPCFCGFMQYIWTFYFEIVSHADTWIPQCWCLWIDHGGYGRIWLIFNLNKTNQWVNLQQNDRVILYLI